MSQRHLAETFSPSRVIKYSLSKEGIQAVSDTLQPPPRLDHQHNLELLFFSGRLYRKTALCDLLADVTANEDTVSDEGLAFLALRQWKDKAHLKLEGAFVALYRWNKALYAIRGAYDSPAFFYTVSDNNLFFSTDAKAIVKTLSRPIVIRSDTIKHFLAFGRNLAEEHPFTGLNTVPSGQGVMFDSLGRTTNLESHYPLQAMSPSRLRNDVRDWQSTMTESLNDIGSGQKSIALFLSGGIDSGSIAAFASQNNLPIQAINMALPGYPDEDESQYSAQLASQLGIPYHQVVVEKNCFDDLLSTPANLLSPGINPYQPLINTGYDCADGLGASMLWTGTVGDEVHAPYQNTFRDLYYIKGLLQALRHLTSESASDVFVQSKIWLKSVLRLSSRRLRFPEYILHDVNEPDNYFQPAKLIGSGDASIHRNRIFQFNYINASALESEHLRGRSFERVHPYLHPAVIELGFRIPAFSAHNQQYKKLIPRQSLSSQSLENSQSLKDLAWRRRVGVLDQYYTMGWRKNRHTINSILLDKNEAWSQFINKNYIIDSLNNHSLSNAMVTLNCLSLELWLYQLRSQGLNYTFE